MQGECQLGGQAFVVRTLSITGELTFICLALLLLPLLQRLLAGMRDRGATAAVLEVDSEAQATGSLQWVEPTIAVFTNSVEDPNSMFSSKQVRKQQQA